MADPRIGQTPDYQQFVTTWVQPCGDLGPIFQAQLAELIEAELAAAGEDVLGVVRETLAENSTHWRALDRLLTDLAAHLDGHDCYREDCLKWMAPAARICPGRADLVRRLQRARAVLGLLDSADGEA